MTAAANAKLRAAGAKAPQGLPGLDLLDEQPVARRKQIYGECFTHNAVDLNEPASSLRWRWAVGWPYKVIVPAASNEPKDVVQLYDLSADPHEMKNIAGEKPEIVNTLRQELDAWWKPEWKSR